MLDKPGSAGEGAMRLAARVPSPAGARAAARAARYPNPEPEPGGVRREYWIQARTMGWNVVPTGRDEWMAARSCRKSGLRAYVYQEIRPASPRRGRRRHARADAARRGRRQLVVHFRNADRGCARR